MPDRSNMFVVFATAEIQSNVITKFLNDAYNNLPPPTKYALITSSDTDVAPKAAEPPIESNVKTTNVDSCADAVPVIQKLSADDIENRYFITLDSYTNEDGSSCLIGDAQSENYVRCSFGLSRLVLDALLNGSRKWPDLWLDAALTGGVITRHREDLWDSVWRYRSIVEEDNVRQSIETLQVREVEEELDLDKDRPFAVFCTVDVPLSMLNDLLNRSNSPDFRGLCILDTTEPDANTRTTKASLESFTSPFHLKSFAWILSFVTNSLPQSPLNSERFLILDPYTLSQHSVLHVDTKGPWQDDVDTVDVHRDVFAARESFEAAYNCLVGATESMQEFAVEAATGGGVYKYSQ